MRHPELEQGSFHLSDFRSARRRRVERTGALLAQFLPGTIGCTHRLRPGLAGRRISRCVLLRCLGHYQYRYGRQSEHAFGDAAEQRAPDPGSAMGPDDDRIGLDLVSGQ